MNQTLVVIDMQNCFVDHSNPTYSSVIKNVSKEVRAAVKKRNHILFVEYVVHSADVPKEVLYQSKSHSYYPTLPEITNLTEGYDNVTYVFKRGTDGGTEVVQTLREKGIPLDSIRVCGAYTSACVSETVQTMAIKLRNSEIELVEPALASYAGCSWSQEAAIAYMITNGNVKLDRHVSMFSE